MPEDVEIVKEALEQYHQLHFSANVMPESLESFNTIHDFYEALAQHQEEQQQTESDPSKKAFTNFPLVFSSEHYLVYQLPDEWTEKNDNEMKAIFEGTRWCVNTSSAYNRTYSPPYYMVFSKRGKRVGLVNPSSAQFKNPSDRPIIDHQIIEELAPFIRQIAERFFGDFSVFIELVDIDILEKITTHQLIGALPAVPKRLSPEMEKVALDKIFSSLNIERVSVIGPVLSYAFKFSIEDLLEKASVFLEKIVKKDLSYEHSDLQTYKTLISDLVRYCRFISNDLKTYIVSVGLFWLKQQPIPGRIGPLTRFCTTFNINLDELKQVVVEKLKEEPVGFAYLVRKKRTPIPVLDQNAKESLSRLIHTAPNLQTIKDAFSGLIDYYYNAHEGVFPDWLLEIVENLRYPIVISSRVRLMGVQVKHQNLKNNFEEYKKQRYRELKETENKSSKFLLVFENWQKKFDFMGDNLLEALEKTVERFATENVLSSYIRSRTFEAREVLGSSFYNLYYKNYIGQELEFLEVKITKVNRKRITVIPPPYNHESPRISLALSRINPKSQIVDFVSNVDPEKPLSRLTSLKESELTGRSWSEMATALTKRANEVTIIMKLSKALEETSQGTLLQAAIDSLKGS